MTCRDMGAIRNVGVVTMTGWHGGAEEPPRIDGGELVSYSFVVEGGACRVVGRVRS